MIPKALQDFVAQALAATENGKLRWTEGSEQSFFSTHKDVKINFARHWDEEEDIPFFILQVKMPDGRNMPIVVNKEDGGDFKVMQTFYGAISANALDIAKDLKDLFK